MMASFVFLLSITPQSWLERPLTLSSPGHQWGFMRPAITTEPTVPPRITRQRRKLESQAKPGELTRMKMPNSFALASLGSHLFSSRGGVYGGSFSFYLHCYIDESRCSVNV